MGVGEEEVDARVLHLAEQRAEVLAVELEGFVDLDEVVAAVLADEVLHSLAEILAVGGVLPEHGHARGLGQLARLLPGPLSPLLTQLRGLGAQHPAHRHPEGVRLFQCEHEVR